MFYLNELYEYFCMANLKKTYIYYFLHVDFASHLREYLATPRSTVGVGYFAIGGV